MKIHAKMMQRITYPTCSEARACEDAAPDDESGRLQREAMKHRL